MTALEFKAYCAELAAKLQDGRALEEAKARLRAKRTRPKTAEEQLDDDFAWDLHSPEANRWHD